MVCTLQNYMETAKPRAGRSISYNMASGNQSMCVYCIHNGVPRSGVPKVEKNPCLCPKFRLRKHLHDLQTLSQGGGCFVGHTRTLGEVKLQNFLGVPMAWKNMFDVDLGFPWVSDFQTKQIWHTWSASGAADQYQWFPERIVMVVSGKSSATPNKGSDQIRVKQQQIGVSKISTRYSGMTLMEPQS